MMRTMALPRGLADVLHQREAGVLGLHHHVEQHHRDIGMRARMVRLGRTVGIA